MTKIPYDPYFNPDGEKPKKPPMGFWDAVGASILFQIGAGLALMAIIAIGHAL